MLNRNLFDPPIHLLIVEAVRNRYFSHFQPFEPYTEIDITRNYRNKAGA